MFASRFKRWLLAERIEQLQGSYEPGGTEHQQPQGELVREGRWRKNPWSLHDLTVISSQTAPSCASALCWVTVPRTCASSVSRQPGRGGGPERLDLGACGRLVYSMTP